MRSTTLILFVLLLTESALAERPSAVNRLYQYESALRDQIATLETAGETPRIPLAQAWITLPKKRKALGESGKVKLPAGTPLKLLSVERKGSRLYWSVLDSLDHTFSLKSHGSFEEEFLEIWNQERHSHCADSLQMLSLDRLKSLRLLMAKQELEDLNPLAKRFRKERGRHRQMDPIALLRSQVLPDLNNLEEPLLLAWSNFLPLATAPWGVPSEVEDPTPEAEWPILVFFGEEDSCWKFAFAHQPDAYYFIQPTWFQNSANRELVPDFGPLMADLTERRRAARRYDLLKEWTPADVDRILNGLAWIGMKRAMLEEALGQPASCHENGASEIWTYAEGNRVRLENDRVVEINQSTQP
jgi:hypothetical protein